MRASTFLRGLAAAGVALGGYIALDSGLPGDLAMSSAQAKEFYTRKRVNGQWVTGMFPAETAGETTPVVRRRPRFVARRIKPAAAKTTTAAIAAKVAPPAPIATDPPAKTDTASAGVPATPITDRALLPTVAVSEPDAAPGATASASPVDAGLERLTRLRAALMARAQELASSGASVSSAFVSGTLPPPAAPTTAPGLGPTPPSAAARPAEITAQTGSGADKVAARSDEAKGLEPKAVSYDFETGVKTTTFANSVVREPFDVAAMKRIAAPTR